MQFSAGSQQPKSVGKLSRNCISWVGKQAGKQGRFHENAQVAREVLCKLNKAHGACERVCDCQGRHGTCTVEFGVIAAGWGRLCDWPGRVCKCQGSTSITKFREEV